MFLGGAIAGLSFALTNEYVRIQRGAAKSCPKCSAPVGSDGIYRGEREPRFIVLNMMLKVAHVLSFKRLAFIIRVRSFTYFIGLQLAISVMATHSRLTHRKAEEEWAHL